MSVKLEIFFVDLIGYAIRDHNLWALMPKAECHIPMLIYFSDQTPPDGEDLGHGLKAAFPIDRHVEIDGDQGTGVMFPGTEPAQEVPKLYHETFNWVTKLDKYVHPDLENCRLDPSVLDKNPTTISSRFLLKGGTIRSERFVLDHKDSPDMPALRFPKGPNRFRAMVNVSRLERDLDRDLDTDPVTLRLETFSGVDPSYIVLNPKDGKVSCAYMNLAAEEADPDGTGQGDGQTQTPGPGSHFPTFAKLLECPERLPPDDELRPTAMKKYPSVNEPFTGFMRAMKEPLGDEGILKCLASKFCNRAVFTNPEACPQGRYD